MKLKLRPGPKAPGPNKEPKQEERKKPLLDLRAWPTDDRSMNTFMHLIETTFVVVASDLGTEPMTRIVAAVVVIMYLRALLSLMAGPNGGNDVAANLLMLAAIGTYMVCTGVVLLDLLDDSAYLVAVAMAQTFAGGLLQGLVFRDEFDAFTKKFLEELKKS